MPFLSRVRTETSAWKLFATRRPRHVRQANVAASSAAGAPGWERVLSLVRALVPPFPAAAGGGAGLLPARPMLPCPLPAGAGLLDAARRSRWAVATHSRQSQLSMS
jgi:hypothetical protein